MSLSTDDPTVGNEEKLLRRVRPDQIVWDDNEKRFRPSSGAFYDSSDGSGMSISLDSVLQEYGHDASYALRGYGDQGLVVLTAAFVRSLKQGVIREPLPEDPAHGEVVGKKTQGIRRQFANNATWLTLSPWK